MDLSGLVVVLVRPEGPQNVGGVARLCGNFGVTLRLVAPQCDVDCRDALKMAHPCEAALRATPRLASLDDALADVAFSLGTSGKISAAITAPPLDVERARSLLPTPPEKLALVFGNERTGLAKDEAARCARLVRLPTPGPVDSFNLGSAVAVTLTLFAAAATTATETRATTSSRAALLSEWQEALARGGFFRTTTAEAFSPRLVELLSKMDLSERDVALLREMLALTRR